MVNESTCGRVKRQDVPQPTAVSTSQVSQMRMTENLGVLWPIWLYEQKKGKKPEPKTIVRASRGNEKILGVILDESVHGFPVGAIRLEHVHIDEIKKTLYDDDDESEAYRQGCSEHLYNKAKEAMVGPSLVRKKDTDQTEEYIVKAMRPVRKRPSDESSEVDLLGGLLPSGVQLQMAKKCRSGDKEKEDNGGGGEEDDDGAQPNKHRRTPGATGRGSSSKGQLGDPKKNDPQEHATPPRPKVSKQENRQIREIGTANLCLTEANQLLAMATSSRELKAIGAAHIESCVKKCRRMVKDEMVEILCAESVTEQDDLSEPTKSAAEHSLSDKGIVVIAKL